MSTYLQVQLTRSNLNQRSEMNEREAWKDEDEGSKGKGMEGQEEKEKERKSSDGIYDSEVESEER